MGNWCNSELLILHSLARTAGWPSDCQSRTGAYHGLAKIVPERTIPLLSNNTEDLCKAGINIVAGEEQSLVCLSGRVDIDSSPILRDRLLKLLQGPQRKSVSVDLSAVTHIDSSGVATLIEALRIARENNSKLNLQGLNDRLRRFFELTGLLPLFNGSKQAITEPAQRAV
jgi:anti-sigma B factor antagonist